MSGREGGRDGAAAPSENLFIDVRFDPRNTPTVGIDPSLLPLPSPPASPTPQRGVI